MALCNFARDGEYLVCGTCRRRVKTPSATAIATCRPVPGLGDVVKATLSAVGVTEERVTRIIGRPCGCGKRVEALNRLSDRLLGQNREPPETA